MPGDNYSRDITSLQIQLITTILKLSRHGVPVLAVWYQQNRIRTQGTKHLKEYFTELDSEAIDKAMEKDIHNFVSPETDEHVIGENIPEKLQAKQIFEKICQDEVQDQQHPDILPFPLSCMSKKEKITWLTRQMLKEQRLVSGGISNTVRYGDPDLMPSFWLNDEWDWTLLTKNLSNVAVQNYTGPGQFPDFLARLVHNCLAMKGQDPETFYDENVDRKLLNKKIKNRGKHNESKMEIDETQAGESDPKDDLDVMHIADEDNTSKEDVGDDSINAYESIHISGEEIKKEPFDVFKVETDVWLSEQILSDMKNISDDLEEGTTDLMPGCQQYEYNQHMVASQSSSLDTTLMELKRAHVGAGLSRPSVIKTPGSRN